jgi:O-antigen ligase
VLGEASGRGAGSPGASDSKAAREEFGALRERVAARSGSWSRRLLLGYGPGNFGIVQGMTYEAGTHNLFLDALATTGIPGLVLIAALWLCLLFVSGRAFARSPQRCVVEGPVVCVTSQSLFAAVLTMLLCAGMVNVRVDNLGTSLFGAVLWLLIATACEADRARPARGEDEEMHVA